MFIFKEKRSLIWFIVTAALLVIFTVVTILSSTFFYGTFGLALGRERAIYQDGIEPRFISDYSSKEDSLVKSNEFNVRLNEEGIILLKNDNNALPIRTPQSPQSASARPKISVFGKHSVNIAYGGSGSGGATSGSGITNLYSALDAAGFDANPVLKAFYENNSTSSGGSGPARPKNPDDLDSGRPLAGIAVYETPAALYTQTVKNSFQAHNEAALVVFTRIGGEGFDLSRTMKQKPSESSPIADAWDDSKNQIVPGARSKTDHYLQLDQNETDLLAMVNEYFNNIIVILNTGNPIEAGFLTTPGHYAYQPNIKAALWIGFPGNSGLTALGKVLNGTVNPSGRTVDTWASEFKSAPVWNNFSGNNVASSRGGNNLAYGDQYNVAGTWHDFHFVRYQEGIYVGYRYYETAHAEALAGNYNGFVYDEQVVFPFGYGLSYDKKFSWTVSDKSSIDGKTIAAGEKYTIKVTVKNNGSVAGREVVQLYGHAPYTAGGIEKAHKVLAGFAKTKIIAPDGGEDTVEIEFNPYYLASYDYAGTSGFKGYVLEGGSGYKLFLSSDSSAQSEIAEIPFSVPAGGIKYDKDPITGKTVKNQFSGQSNANFNSDTRLGTLMSRRDFKGTWPAVPTDTDRNVTQSFINALNDTGHNNPRDFSNEELPWFGRKKGLTFRDMLLDADGNELDYVPHDAFGWQDLLEQATFNDMADMVAFASYETKKMDSIGKPATLETDGPSGFTNFITTETYYGTCYYAAQIVVASTWNEELVEAFGISVGNEGIWGNYKVDGMPYSGWYAPGANIHRSQFGGRTFEYFSEDSFLTGRLAAAQIRGAQSRGVYCYIKHFALNEQETHRSMGGLVTWATEQSIREMYLRPFEMAVKEGGTRAVMSSFNRIGTRWTGGDYRLLTEILRKEWDFKGTVICDFNTATYMNTRQMAYAGGDLNLMMLELPRAKWADATNVADAIVLRDCVHNILYTIINSNAMNGEIKGYKMPYWQIGLIVFDCVLVTGLGIWGFFAVRKAYKKANKLNN